MTRVIIIDWGTSSFRAWLVARDTGAVLDTLPSGKGLRAMAGQSFPAYARDRLAPWRNEAEGTPPVLMAGMVGAPSGWRKAAQPPLPVGTRDLAAQVVPAEGLAKAWILPGAHVRGADGHVDVMRGEEVQVLGALALLGRSDGLFCLPGTHSKWARAEGGRLVDFATFLTGEMRAVLLGHSILGEPATADAPFDPAAFDQGLAQAATPGGPLHHVFSSRGRFLYGALAPEGVASFLSGVLIGAELDGALARAPDARTAPIALVGGASLQAPYERALTARGLRVEVIPADQATRAGVLAVATDLGV
ncbi:2-dehydro-3-deoxygalactonokinase [Roseospira visakhapatnamensis]|uniref:2-dehydro-3-deoxygalactonokinase n=1 Tax=Roseospira visakhapatnamensis TaxID=390880 RepID=A0A7W6W9I6_9PROT|nr:2-dehydro-3-deoxygalactonokinase [Roseospira visakhapatnamensis]MBB4265521.1 2-dehydro-3-deoxygalactonokinase [Roseospira visakhapatnamensis]